MIALYNGKTVRPDDWTEIRAALPHSKASVPGNAAQIDTLVNDPRVRILARTSGNVTLIIDGVAFYVDNNRAWAVGGVVSASQRALAPSSDARVAFRMGVAGVIAVALFIVLGSALAALVPMLGGPVAFLACYALFLRR
jgi:hypothetical protein